MPLIKLFDSYSLALQKVPPGAKSHITASDVEICMVNFNGQLFALGNSCPHLGESLAKGTINYLGEIVCPWHSFRFSLKTGEEAERRCRDAEIYPVKIEEDGVYIEL